MKIQEAMIGLLDHFRQNENFVMDRDYKKIELICVDDDYTKGVINKALEHLEKQEIVEKVSQGDKTWHVLMRPLEHHQQQLTINYPLNLILADIINAFAKKEKENYSCDPLNITQLDIQFLANVIGSLLNASTSQNTNSSPKGGNP